MSKVKRKLVNFGLSLVGPIAMIIILTMPIGPLTGGLQIIAPTGGIFDVGIGAIPPQAQTIQLPGLNAQVKVLVDQWGIPHIYADSVEDAFMALGYFHAKDRLFQMYIQNYLAAGRISEMVGAYAASSDRFYRTIGLARSAQETLDYYEAHTDNPLIAESLSIIDAEVAGVNAFIDSMTSQTTPIEFKILGFTPPHWRRLDIFIFANMMTWGLSGGISDLYMQWVKTTVNNDTMFNDLFNKPMPYSVPIVPEQYNLSIAEYPNANGGYPATADPSSVMSGAVLKEAYIPKEKLDNLISMINNVIMPFGESDWVGSNNWVANGSLTTTGMPILCNDPHLGFQTPSIWYEAQLVVPGVLDVTGVTLPGLPGVILGHTDHMAWGFTNVGADVLDIFVEQLNPNNSSEYMYNGAYRAFKVVDETIHTREGVDIPFNVSLSVHGPLIDSVTNTYGEDTQTARNIAMNWTGNAVSHQLLAIDLLNRAKNLQDYYDAIYWWDSPAQNIIYADDQGNIAITVCGRFPIRSGYTGQYPVQALNDSVGMVSNIPYAYIPRSVNPAQGYLASANQISIDFSNYGFAINGPFADGYRGRRINYLLSHDNTVTIDDMKRFQADALEVRAQEIVPLAVQAWDDAGNSNTTMNQIVDLLRNWDYIMDPDMSAPTVWMFLRDAIHYEVFDEIRTISPDLPLSRTPILEEILRTNNTYYIDDHTTPGVVENRDQILVRALYRAVDAVAADPAFGTNITNWNYGNKHLVYYDHLAGLTTVGGIPIRGQDTLDAAGGWRVTHGPSWRLVADLSNISQSYGVFAPGQSGNLFSPHFRDLFDLQYTFDETTQEYGYHMIYFYSTPEAFIAADTQGTMIEETVTFVK